MNQRSGQTQEVQVQGHSQQQDPWVLLQLPTHTQSHTHTNWFPLAVLWLLTFHWCHSIVTGSDIKRRPWMDVPHTHLLQEFSRCVCVRVCVYTERKRSVLTAQSNDVAAVFMDKFLSHSFLHNLLHLRMKESEWVTAAATGVISFITGQRNVI